MKGLFRRAAPPPSPPRLLAVLRGPEAAEAAALLLREMGVEAEVRIGTLAALLGELAEADLPEILLIDLDMGDEAEMRLLDAVLHDLSGRLAVIATSAKAGVEAVRLAMRMGVVDFVPQPLAADDINAALEAAERRLHQGRPTAQAARRGNILCFAKASGGMGATTLAVQAAHALAQDGPTCLLDLDIQFGDAALQLDLEGDLDLSQVLHAPERLDGTFLRGLMRRHRNGLDLLAAPRGMEAADALHPEIAEALLDTARNEYRHAVVDMSAAWTEGSRALLRLADRIFLVTQPLVPAIRQTRRLLDILARDELGAPVKLVLNRFERRAVRLEDAERALGRPIDYRISNHFRAVADALDQGLPLAEAKGGHKIARQIGALVSGYLDIGKATDGRTGLFKA